MESQKKKSVRKRSKKMSDAQLDKKEPSMAEYFTEPEILESNEVVELAGEENAPPLEMTDEDLEGIVAKQVGQNEQQVAIRSNTEHYNNAVNKWELIAKTWNKALDWEHVTTAMNVGSLGCLVMVKEAIGNKMHSTMTYVPGCRITEDKNGKKIIG